MWEKVKKTKVSLVKEGETEGKQPQTLDAFMQDYIKEAKKKDDEAQKDHEDEVVQESAGTTMRAAMMKKKLPSKTTVFVQETTVDADEHMIESGFSCRKVEISELTRE